MRKDDVIRYFGTVGAAALAIGVKGPAVSQWGEIVPLGSACKIEKITDGALSVDLSLYKKPLSQSA